MKKLFMLLLATLMLVSAAAAEGQLGDLPQRGLIVPMMQEDVDMGLELDYVMLVAQDNTPIPAAYVLWNAPGAKDALARMEAAMESGDSAALQAAQEEYRTSRYLMAYVYLIGEDLDETLYATIKDVTTGIGTNEGYEYRYEIARFTLEDAERQAQVDAAADRIRELLDNARFQAIAFDPYELPQEMGAFPEFETQDLNGNTVTNEVFAGKKLTVVNIWGTYCGPCINEMPELAAWAAEMPEDVQLIGLVSDLGSIENTSTLDKAKLICDTTGVNYINLVANEDFADLLRGVTGVPTTIFVDGNGQIVGEQVVGAYVSRYKEQVEKYLDEQ